MTIDLENLRRLAQAATPGPWFSTNGTVWYVTTGGNGEPEQDKLADSNEDDAAFIAAANPETMLELLDEIERLRGLLKEAIDQIWAWGDDSSHIFDERQVLQETLAYFYTELEKRP